MDKKVTENVAETKKLSFKAKQKEETTAIEKINSEVVVEFKKLSFKEKLGRFFKSQEGWLFVLPAVLLMVLFTFYPIVNAFVRAFMENYDGLTDTFTGWGFGNFKAVLTGNTGGAKFTQCFFNTFVITFISVPLSTLLALIISVALNSIKALQKAYQTILFLPYLTNALAMGAVFKQFFNVIGTTSKVYTYGIANNFLMNVFGLDPIYWIDKIRSPYFELFNGAINVPWAKYIVLIIYEVWSGLPFKILILFSSLQSVNKQYYDAAKVDGASKSTTLWKITAPLISPMISYLLITGLMGGMKQYTAVVGIYGEDMGFNYDMGTVVGYIYRFINTGRTGYAFAGSLILFVIIMIITIINTRISKKRVHY